MADTIAPGITLPSAHPTLSYWQDPPSPLANHRSTEGLPDDADIVIIGSGITGASIADKILNRKPTTKVVMLEARELCCGATGRNGGHLRTGRYLQFAKFCTTYGVPEAIKVLQFENDTVRTVSEFIKEHAIECDLHSVEGVDVFFDQEEFDEAVRTVNLMNSTIPPGKDETHYANGLPIPQIHHPPSTCENFRIPAAKGIITIPAATLSPYKLVCALISRSLLRGLNLQTNTPALSLTLPSPSPSSSSTRGSWTILTPRGNISTKTVVLATNAFTPQLHPPLSPYILPVRGQMLASPPSAALIAAGGLDRSYSFMYRGGHDDYLIVRPPGASGEGDILLGGGRAYARGGEEGVLGNEEVNGKVSEHLSGATASYFRSVGDEDEEGEKAEWTGIMGFTRDGMPVVGALEVETEKGLWVAAGFNGHGMAFCFLCAEALVTLVLGGEGVEEWLPDCFRVGRFGFGREVE